MTNYFRAIAADESTIGLYPDMTAARKAIEGREGACVRNAAGDIVAMLPKRSPEPYRSHRGRAL